MGPKKKNVSFKEKIESNLTIWMLGTLFVGFSAGFTAYQTILKITNSTVIMQGTLTALEKDAADLQAALDDEKDANAALQAALDAEKDVNVALQAALDAEKDTNVALQAALDAEKERVSELQGTVVALSQELQAAGYLKQEPEYTDTKNDFEDQDDVVLDRATGLMWQKSGSPDHLSFQDAQQYIQQLNSEKFAGYVDWRLPTINELMSLLEPDEQSTGLYIDSIFDKQKLYCWSATQRSPGSVWFVDFGFGDVSRIILDNVIFVRAVRF